MSQQNRADYEPIGEVNHQFLKNPAHDDSPFNLHSFKHHYRGTIIYHFFCILLLGLPYIIFAWYPFLQKLRFRKCSLATADVVFIYDNFGKCSIIHIRTDKVSLSPPDVVKTVRTFRYQYTKYAWITEKASFDTLDEFMPKICLDDVVERSQGLRKLEEINLLTLYGPNIIEVEVKSYWRLFIEEVFNPFYIFQAFSVILWFFDDYMIYAGCVFVLTLFSSIASLVQTRKQSVALHNLAATSHRGKVQVLRTQIISDPEVVTVDTSELVPGHLLVIPRGGCIMPCDAILLTGNCIVNESMLTGESVPVMKSPPNSSDEIYNSNIHKAHTLFSGTHVIQGRYYGDDYILARVIRTGFDTTKGSLVKSIMFPAPIGFKFYRDSLKFVFFLFIIAGIGMAYCVYLYIERHADVREIIIRTLDIITIVVPPALPAAMAVGIVYSQHRLRNLGIFCISPPRINICGKLKLACFDKTGTLTHEGLDMYSILPASGNRFLEPVSEITELDNKEPLVQAMAACHSLTRIEGVLNGDPLDLIMFEHTKWLLEEPGKEDTNYDMLTPTIVRPIQTLSNTPLVNIAGGDVELPYEIGLIRQFQFSSSLQRMSVICRILDSPNMIVYTKGAPERITSMCVYETVPPDFSNRLAQFTAQGFRVIALAYKQLPQKFKWKDSQKVKREIIECDLNFLGFVVMQNTLKPETTPVITTLRSANIRTVMITGDNVMTAICVARECGMVQVHDNVVLLHLSEENDDVIPKIHVEHIGNVDSNQSNVISFNDNHYHFAMDGRTWSKLRTYYPNILPAILLRTTVFARFQPDHKTQLITHLQELDYIVSMVGDGANDCGALKAAHVGVSLSQAEASVAAPFTSSIENISCLIHLMLEGRCALVTSFAVFKYMALYSLIQFITIIILYKNNSILGDQQFLFIDLIITTSLAVTIGRQGPYKYLVAKRPMGSLITGTNLLPMVLQILLCGCVQFGALYYLTVQEWYTPNSSAKDEIILCWENTVLFLVSSFQYVILALVYSKGRPYRQILLTNFWLLLCALSLTAFTTYLCVYPSEEVAKFFEIIYLPAHDKSAKVIFRDTLLIFPMVHLLISCFIEFFVAESRWLKVVIHFVTRKKDPKNKYKKVSKEMDFHNWFRQDNEKSILNLPERNNV